MTQKQIISLFLAILLFSLLVQWFQPVYADNLRLEPKYIALSQVRHTEARMVYFETTEDDIIADVFGVIRLDLIDAPTTLGIPVGRYNNTDLKMVIAFDLEEIPSSKLMEETLINSVQIKALIQKPNNPAKEKFFLTASVCPEVDWSLFIDAIEKQKKLQSDNGWKKSDFWEKSKLIKNEFSKFSQIQPEENSIFNNLCLFVPQALDSLVVDPNELPQVYTWDITEGLIDAKNEEKTTLNLVLSSSLLKVGPQKNGAIAKLSGYESTTFKNKAGIGLNAIPWITVNYITQPTNFSNLINYGLTIVIPTLAVIIPFVIWIYRRTKT